MPAEPSDTRATRPLRRHLEDAAMSRALELAREDRLAASLGPRGGCVILGADGTVVGEARTDRAARVHATAQALAEAGHRAQGATAVVTLEPCCLGGDGPRAGASRATGPSPLPHGPCAQALVDAGVRRVVVARLDPDPGTSGGAALLRDAGVEVVAASATAADEALSLNRAWTFGVQTGRPLVTWVVEGGGSAGGPNPDLDRLRAQVDTLVVSTWAVLAHDVSLAVLGPDGHPAARQPLRVVVGTRELDPGLPIFDGPGRTLHFATRDPALTLAAVYDLGGRHVLLSGGTALAAEFLRAGLVDEIISHVTPEWTAQGGVGATDLGVGELPDATRLVDVRLVDDDAGRPRMRVTLVPGTSPLVRTAGSGSRAALEGALR